MCGHLQNIYSTTPCNFAMLGNCMKTKNHAINAEQFDGTAQKMVTGTIFLSNILKS